jgi:hypothetical protein
MSEISPTSPVKAKREITQDDLKEFDLNVLKKPTPPGGG